MLLWVLLASHLGQWVSTRQCQAYHNVLSQPWRAGHWRLETETDSGAKVPWDKEGYGKLALLTSFRSQQAKGTLHQNQHHRAPSLSPAALWEGREESWQSPPASTSQRPCEPSCGPPPAPPLVSTETRSFMAGWSAHLVILLTGHDRLPFLVTFAPPSRKMPLEAPLTSS